MHEKAFILKNTRIMAPFLCPEIRLHLITDECPLWTIGERELAELAIEPPYWGFCWPGGQVLARYLLDHPETMWGRRILDFGAGCGVEAVAAMLCGARSVLASDIDPLALEAMRLNAALNGIEVETTSRDLIGDPLDGFDVILAGDMFYDPAFAKRVTEWLTSLAERGLTVLLGDPHRGNLAGTPLEALARFQAPSDIDLYGKYLQEAIVYGINPRECSQGR